MKKAFITLVLIASTSTAFASTKSLTGVCELHEGAMTTSVPLNINPEPAKRYGSALMNQKVGPFQVSIQMGNAMVPELFGKYRNDKITISIDSPAGDSGVQVPTLALIRGESVTVFSALGKNSEIYVRCEIAVKSLN